MLPTAIVGKNYNQTLQATGGKAPYTWSLASASEPLPPGLTLASNGAINGTTGTVNFTGSVFNFHVTVRDAAQQTQTALLFIAVANPLMAGGTLPGGNIGIGYLFQLTASGGAFAYHWTVAAGSTPLPAGLTLADTGFLQGKPTVFGTFSFTAQVTDQSTPPQVATGNFSLKIANQLFVTSMDSDLPLGVVSRFYNAQLQAVGGTPPYSWNEVSGTLPTGVNVTSSGQITGTPATSGNFIVNLKVTDNSSPPLSANQTLSFFIEPLPSIHTPLSDGVIQQRYVGEMGIDGGITPFTFSLTAGALPDGLSLPPATTPPQQRTFPFPGTPTKLGTFPFTLQVSDASSPPIVVSQQLSIRIVPQLSFQAPAVPTGIVGLPYSFQFTASGGQPPLSFVLGNCPGGPCAAAGGMNWNPSAGTLTGPPTTPFRDALTVAAVDSANPPQQILQAPVLVVVNQLKITTSALPAIAANVPFSGALGVDGGIPPYTWSSPSGNLPAGLTLDPASGTISGTPTQAGTANFTIQMSDSGSGALAETTSRQYSLAVQSGASLGRNDSPATATPISNGTYRGSISPIVDPVSQSTANPDVDVYKISASPGVMVTIQTVTAGLTPPSPLDTVIEIVDANGVRLNQCSFSFPPDSFTFTQACMNDDTGATSFDSRLLFEVPSTATGPQTVYIRVLDFLGGARPDYVYAISISGAN